MLLHFWERRGDWSNSNAVNIVAVGGSATASCTPTDGNSTATANGAGGLAIAANVNLCFNAARGGDAAAVNTGAITQSGTNTATATNVNSR